MSSLQASTSMHACIQVGEYVRTGKSVSRREIDQAFADRFNDDGVLCRPKQ